MAAEDFLEPSEIDGARLDELQHARLVFGAASVQREETRSWELRDRSLQHFTESYRQLIRRLVPNRGFVGRERRRGASRPTSFCLPSLAFAVCTIASPAFRCTVTTLRELRFHRRKHSAANPERLIRSESDCIPHECRSRTRRRRRLRVNRLRDNDRRFELRRLRFGVPQREAKNGRDHVSITHTSRARVFGLTAVALRSISRSVAVPCPSRQVLEFARANVITDFIEHRTQSAIFRKVGVDLVIPCRLVPLPNEFGQFGQFTWRERLHGIFDLGKTHNRTLTDNEQIGKGERGCRRATRLQLRWKTFLCEHLHLIAKTIELLERCIKIWSDSDALELTRDLPIRSVGFPPTNAVHPAASPHVVFIVVMKEFPSGRSSQFVQRIDLIRRVSCTNWV